MDRRQSTTRENTKMSVKNGQVAIGREFFAKIKLDYADWRWAMVREFLQNSFDAPGCDQVEISVKRKGEHTELIVRNNGEPMTDDVLFNKLLTLGGSGKNFEGENTGGFGVAKSLLYYTHLWYTIVTGSTRVTGNGAQFATEKVKHFPGTQSSVMIEGDEVENLESMVRRFAGFAQWKGTIKLNGHKLTCDLRKGARRRDLGWGVVYTNHSFSNTCIVRINGQPMFTRYTRFKGCVIVELNGKAFETLTSNRDGLNGRYANELSDLLTAIAVDKRSALREQKADYKRYLGEKLKNEAKQPKVAAKTLADLIDVASLEDLVAAGPTGEVAPPTATVNGGGSGIRVIRVAQQDVASVTLNHEFIVKNTTGMVTPAYHVPGDEFSRYSSELVRAWVAVLLKIHQIMETSAEFSVGFVFDEENVAECERGAYGLVYYINPVRVVCQRDKPQCRSFKARYTGAWTNRFDIIASAIHEFVHGAYGLMEHDEDYAAKLTEVMGEVMGHARELSALFRQ